jgi:soluble lytic murein transglycosylase-like protein
MTKILRLLLFSLVTATPVLAQGNAYSFDNFDMRNGVRITVAPTSTPTPRLRKRAKAPALKTSVTAVAPKQAINADALPLSTRPLINNTSLNYSTASIASSATSLRGYTTGNSEVDRYLVESGTRNGVDPLLLYSIMHQESTFKSYAVSPKGARGLMQLMPMTAMRYGVTNIFDPKQNIEGGARYMSFLLDRFDNDVSLALAGYNAGEGAVEKYGWQIPPYSETQEYVRRITRRYALLRDPNAAIYAQHLNRSQVAALQSRQSQPLTTYERSIFTVRLPDGRLELTSQ